MTKAQKKIDNFRAFLKEEIKKRKAILKDEFMRSNMYAMDLGMMEIEIDIYKQMLRKLGK